MIQVEVADRIKRLPPYLFGQLNALKYQKRRANEDIIDLGMGNPTDATPQPIIDKLCEAVRDPRNHRYSEATGLFNLKREVAKSYETLHGVSLDPDTEVICTIGSKEGLSHLALALLGPGDTALVPTPAFPPHIYGLTLAGASVIGLPLTEPENFMSHLSYVAANMCPRPKLILLNYPHNPTAATVELGFFEEICQFAKRHHIIVLHDFAYGQTTFDGYKAPSFLQAQGAKDVGVEFSTMSKAFNMAGWRVGFMVGHRDIIGSLSRIKGYYDYGLFQPVQIASIIGLRECQDFAIQQAQVYQSRRDVLCDGLERIGWPVQRPKGTMFVWAEMPERYKPMGSIEFAMKLMNDAQVAVAPGRGFGEEGEGFLRLALVENELRLRQAVRQIGRALNLT